MLVVPNQFRVRSGPMESDDLDMCNGVFLVPRGEWIFQCVVSDGEGWEHVSVLARKHGSSRTFTPLWNQMCFIKDKFWGPDQCVVQYHPAQVDYVNIHPNVLHLWKPVGAEFEVPQGILV